MLITAQEFLYCKQKKFTTQCYWSLPLPYIQWIQMVFAFTAFILSVSIVYFIFLGRCVILVNCISFTLLLCCYAQSSASLTWTLQILFHSCMTTDLNKSYSAWAKWDFPSDDLFGVKTTRFQGLIILTKCFRLNIFECLMISTKFEGLFFHMQINLEILRKSCLSAALRSVA